MKILFINFYVLLICLSGKSQIISTIAGNINATGVGDNGPCLLANITYPTHIAFDKQGNTYIAESILPSGGIRKINKNGIITTVIKDFDFNSICNDHNGNLYISRGDTIFKMDTAGNKTYLAGGGKSTASGIPATQAYFYGARGMAFDNKNNMYISDLYRVMKIDSLGLIYTIAGTFGIWNYSGDNGPASNALFHTIYDIVMDKQGNIYITDEGNDAVRKIDTSGSITAFAGNGTHGYSGDGGLAVNASLRQPTGITIDSSGNLFFSDNGNNVVRKVDTNGIIITYAGSGGYGFKDGPALQATLGFPEGLATDSDNNLLITDFDNGLIRKVTPANLPVVLKLFKVERVIPFFNGKNSILVSWETTSEINVGYFNIQRSEDGTTFNAIGKVNAKGAGAYSFNDPLTIQDSRLTMYYRLEIVDKNGAISYSVIKEISVGNDNDLQVFPNPTIGNVTVSSKAFNIKTISIIDIFGRTVMEKQADGANNVQLDFSKEAKGLYIIKTISNTGVLNIQKIVVN